MMSEEETIEEKMDRIVEQFKKDRENESTSNGK
jgi:hypothetical protein